MYTIRSTPPGCNEKQAATLHTLPNPTCSLSLRINKAAPSVLWRQPCVWGIPSRRHVSHRSSCRAARRRAPCYTSRSRRTWGRWCGSAPPTWSGSRCRWSWRSSSGTAAASGFRPPPGPACSIPGGTGWGQRWTGQVGTLGPCGVVWITSGGQYGAPRAIGSHVSVRQSQAG